MNAHPPDIAALRMQLGSAPLLLVGAAGMLGRAFRQILGQLAIRHATHDLDTLDITQAKSVAAAFVAKPRVVINCAAWTNVDAAESNQAEAHKVNATGPANLAQACLEMNATLVHFSTDYVFSGDATAPYRTDHPIQPINAYGRTKAAGEAAIRASGCDHLILRTSWLYAPWGGNFVRTIAKAAREKPLLKVVNDQRGRPTSAEGLARKTLALLNAGARGTHHATDAGECTWFDFARHIAALTKAPARVEPCSSAEFPRPARRPAYSVLDIGMTESLIGPLIPWESALESVVSRLEP